MLPLAQALRHGSPFSPSPGACSRSPAGGLPAARSGDLKRRVKRILEVLDEEDPLGGDLTAPTLRLHSLKGDRRGQWSVRVDRAWRIVFRVEGGSVFDVDLSDYH